MSWLMHRIGHPRQKTKIRRNNVMKLNPKSVVLMSIVLMTLPVRCI